MSAPPAAERAAGATAARLPAYAELHCLSNFTFLRGASHPQELIARARELGYRALALTDECSVAGVVRAHMAARGGPLRFVVGSEFRLDCGLKFVALARDRSGYGALCRLITRARRAGKKGSYHLTRADLAASPPGGCFFLWVPGARPAEEELAWLAPRFRERLHVAVELLREGDDAARLAQLTALGARHGVPLLAAGDVHMHVRGRRQLQDALTAIRLRVPLAQAGRELHANGERYLRERERLARLYPRALLENAAALAAECHFSLDELRYEYPRELVPPGETPTSHLRQLTEAGARWRWPQGVPPRDRAAIEHELGDVLFSLANLGRKLSIPPEEALRGAIARFLARFGHVERQLAARGVPHGGATLAEMDALWEEAKSLERQGKTEPSSGAVGPPQGLGKVGG